MFILFSFIVIYNDSVTSYNIMAKEKTSTFLSYFRCLNTSGAIYRSFFYMRSQKKLASEEIILSRQKKCRWLLTAPSFSSHFVYIMTILDSNEFAQPKVSNFQMVCTGIDQENIPEKRNYSEDSYILEK